MSSSAPADELQQSVAWVWSPCALLLERLHDALAVRVLHVLELLELHRRYWRQLGERAQAQRLVVGPQLEQREHALVIDHESALRRATTSGV